MDNMAHYEGTVAPSYLLDRQSDRFSRQVRSLPMRVGRVIRVHYPDTEASYSKKFFEYDVQVQVIGGENEPSTTFTIPHCIVLSAFGGVADYTRWTPRPIIGSPEPDFGKSSNVCVLLINGSNFGGLIVGGLQQTGLQDGSKGDKDDRADGHHRVSVFNGLREEVDSEGQWTVTRKGATDPFGDKLDPSDPEGSKIQLLHGGDLALDSRHDFRSTSDNDFLVQAQKGGTLQAVTAALNLKAATVIQTTSPFVKLGNATDAMLLATRYRVAETTLHTTLVTFLGTLSGLLSGLATSPTPPTVAIPGPPGSAPATPLLLAAAAAATAAASAIATFEAAAPTYLSVHNSLD